MNCRGLGYGQCNGEVGDGIMKLDLEKKAWGKIMEAQGK